MSNNDLDQEQKECLGFITREPGISSETLYDKMCIDRKQVSLVIFQLNRLGLIYKGSHNGKLGYLPVGVSESDQQKHDEARIAKVVEKLKPKVVPAAKEPEPVETVDEAIVPTPAKDTITAAVDKIDTAVTKMVAKPTASATKLPNGNFTRNTINGTIALFLYLNRIHSYTIDEIVTRLTPLTKKSTSIPAGVYMMASNGAITSTKSPIKGRQYTWGYKYNYPFAEIREEDKTYIPDLYLFGDIDELKLSLVTKGKDVPIPKEPEPEVIIPVQAQEEVVVIGIQTASPIIEVKDIPNTVPSPGLDEMLMNQTVIANYNAVTLIESRIASIELELKHLYVLKTTLTNKNK